MTIPLSEKYRPKKFSEIKSQETAIDKLKSFVVGFERGMNKKKAILLHGPAGTGKTTLAHVLAAELGYELFELNSSDLRNRQKLDEVLKPSSLQKSLFAKGKIILVDEVDGVTTTDYGGLAELVILIERAKFPVVITCNDVWQHKFSLLRNKCELVQIKEIPYLAIVDLIKKVLDLEKKALRPEIIKEIAAKSRGDLRAALNDLHSMIYLDDSLILQEGIDMREKAQAIFQALNNVFKLRATENTPEVYDNVEMEMDQIKLWVEENIPLEYKGIELAKAFESLSRADIFKGRIHRQQHWRFMIYENFFLSAGISAAKGSRISTKYTKYNPPKRILKIWMVNRSNAQKVSIAGKFAELTHTSKKRAMKDFAILSLIIDTNTIKTLNLGESEVDYLAEKKSEIMQLAGANSAS